MKQALLEDTMSAIGQSRILIMVDGQCFKHAPWQAWMEARGHGCGSQHAKNRGEVAVVLAMHARMQIDEVANAARPRV